MEQPSGTTGKYGLVRVATGIMLIGTSESAKMDWSQGRKGGSNLGVNILKGAEIAGTAGQ